MSKEDVKVGCHYYSWWPLAEYRQVVQIKAGRVTYVAIGVSRGKTRYLRHRMPLTAFAKWAGNHVCTFGH